MIHRTAVALSCLLLPLVAALGLAAPGQAAAPTGHTRVLSDCRTPAVEPTRILIACADANEYATIRHYASWTGHQARATGRLVVNDCRPDCAAGRFHAYPATFSFHRVVTAADGSRLFSRLGVTYVKGGRQHDTTIDLLTHPLG